MKKLFLALGFCLCCGTVFAQGYVRKTLKPDFFIPQKDLEHDEKLPEFYNYDNAESTQADIIKVIREADDEPSMTSEDEGEDPIETEFEEENSSTQPAVKQAINDYLESSRSTIDKVPSYKQKYFDYINDLKIIAETGEIPDNETLNKDLSKMNSNEKILVK